MRRGFGCGGSIVSKNILDKKGKLKWCIKESPAHELDNGWRFLSEIDTDEFLSQDAHMRVCDWGTVVALEPAVMQIFSLPEGTELMLIQEENRKRFVHTGTGQPLHP